MWKADAGLRLPAVAQILDVMLDLATEDDQRQHARNTLLENGGLARHVLKLANKHLTEACSSRDGPVQRVQSITPTLLSLHFIGHGFCRKSRICVLQLMGGGSGAADLPTTDGSLFDMLEGMGASLFNSFTASINDQQAVKGTCRQCRDHAPLKNECRSESSLCLTGLSLLLIECFQTLCTVVCERLGHNVVAFLDESFAESGGRSDGEGDEALHKHILHLQVWLASYCMSLQEPVVISLTWSRSFIGFGTTAGSGRVWVGNGKGSGHCAGHCQGAVPAHGRQERHQLHPGISQLWACRPFLCRCPSYRLRHSLKWPGPGHGLGTRDHHRSGSGGLDLGKGLCHYTDETDPALHNGAGQCMLT